MTLGGVPLTTLRRADVRRRIVVSDTGATLFSGRLATVLDTGRRRRAAGPGDRLDRRHPRGAARRARHRGRRARPDLLRRAAAAAGAGPRAGRRPGDPGAGRADLGRGRPHRGADRRRGCAATAPAAPRSWSRRARWCSTRSTRWPSCATAGWSRPARHARAARGDPGYRAVVTRESRAEPQPSECAVDERAQHGAARRRLAGRCAATSAAWPAGTRGCSGPRWPCTSLAALAALAAPRLLGDLVQAVDEGTTVGHVDRVVAVLAAFLRGPDGAHPLRAADQPGARRAGAGRAARGLRRQRAGAAGRRGRVGRLRRPAHPDQPRRRPARLVGALGAARVDDRRASPRWSPSSAAVSVGWWVLLPVCSGCRRWWSGCAGTSPAPRTATCASPRRTPRSTRRSPRPSRAPARSRRSASARSGSRRSTTTSRSPTPPSATRSTCARSSSRAWSCPT